MARLNSPSKPNVPIQPTNGLPDLVRRIFLDEMDPHDRLLGRRWPTADEVDQPISGSAFHFAFVRTSLSPGAPFRELGLWRPTVNR